MHTWRAGGKSSLCAVHQAPSPADSTDLNASITTGGKPSQRSRRITNEDAPRAVSSATRGGAAGGASAAAAPAPRSSAGGARVGLFRYGGRPQVAEGSGPGGLGCWDARGTRLGVLVRRGELRRLMAPGCAGPALAGPASGVLTVRGAEVQRVVVAPR